MNFYRVLAHYAEEQRHALELMVLFPSRRYNCYPSCDQMYAFYSAMRQRGYSHESLYSAFCTGDIPDDVDVLVKEHSSNWSSANK